jgi:3D-(3,5/4)-trihydroxycyclohexane-1,2-dione acylhydrolase (decyclizing)
MAGRACAASNGVGVYHIYGDETTRGEGYNMQQVPKEEQGPVRPDDGADGPVLYAAHARGAARLPAARDDACVHHPYKAGPFFVMLPINTQPETVELNLAAPCRGGCRAGAGAGGCRPPMPPRRACWAMPAVS